MMFEVKKTWGFDPLQERVDGVRNEYVEKEIAESREVPALQNIYEEEYKKEYVDEIRDESDNESIVVAEVLLCQMQDTLYKIKELQKTKVDLTIAIQELSTKLADAQAEEIRVEEDLINCNIEWQDMTQKISRIEHLDADSN